MRVVVISDTHNMLNQIKVPSGDLLIHAGDATSRGTEKELVRFVKHIKRLKFEKVIFIPGNHDWIFQQHQSLAEEICGDDITVLIDQAITINGHKFYGSPWQPEFLNWAFNLPRGDLLKAVWDKIPEDTDILITHGPPRNILDEAIDKFKHLRSNEGCDDLLDRVLKIKPRYHIFGHIHEAHGMKVGDYTIFINASIATQNYRPTNKPFQFHLEDRS